MKSDFCIQKLHYFLIYAKKIRTVYSSIEEWRCWEENLKAMAERKVRTILFAPLGEFWNFHFELKNRNSISVKGSISDLEKQQSSLDFEEDIDIENLQESIRCIC